MKSATWIPDCPDTWPIRYGELRADMEFQWQGRHEAVKAGTTVKIVMVSSFGDVGLTNRLDTDNGYGVRGIVPEAIDQWLSNPRKDR